MLTYDLPKELIAQTPCEPRDAARLLVIRREKGTVPERKGDSPPFLSHHVFRDLPEFLKAGDCLVLNDTKVQPARIYGRKAITGGKVELLLLEKGTVPEKKGDSPFFSEKCVIYRCLGQPAKNLKPGTRLQFDEGRLHAEILSWENGERLVRFEGRGVEQALGRLGEMPLPPYIDRPVQPEDAQWYQTVYAREAGAVAAPTAGLHFTPELLDRIRAMGVRVATVTLHVGWGTFKPVGEKEMAEGKLHSERYQIPEETTQAIAETKAKKGRVIAVGTTVVRTLETAGDSAVMPGKVPARATSRVSIPSGLSGEGNERGASAGIFPGISGTTNLFIRPGFKFKVVDALVTNFHLPGTSLLLMVCAFAGEDRIRAAYSEAIREKYRFYSYGDAMVIL